MGLCPPARFLFSLLLPFPTSRTWLHLGISLPASGLAASRRDRPRTLDAGGWPPTGTAPRCAEHLAATSCPCQEPGAPVGVGDAPDGMRVVKGLGLGPGIAVLLCFHTSGCSHNSASAGWPPGQSRWHPEGTRHNLGTIRLGQAMAGGLHPKSLPKARPRRAQTCRCSPRNRSS